MIRTRGTIMLGAAALMWLGLSRFARMAGRMRLVCDSGSIVCAIPIFGRTVPLTTLFVGLTGVFLLALDLRRKRAS